MHVTSSTRHKLDIALGAGTGLLWGFFLSNHTHYALNLGLALATLVFFVEMYFIFIKK